MQSVEGRERGESATNIIVCDGLGAITTRNPAASRLCSQQKPVWCLVKCQSCAICLDRTAINQLSFVFVAKKKINRHNRLVELSQEFVEVKKK